MKLLALIFALVVSGYLCVHFTPAGKRALARMEQSTEIEKMLRQAEDQINSISPKMVDNGIRMDGAKAGPGKRLKYLYTFVGRKAADVDMTVWRNKGVPAVRQKIMGQKEMRALFEVGTTVIYRYSGSDGVLIDEIIITPAEVLRQ